VWNNWEPIAAEVGITSLECAETVYLGNMFPADQSNRPHPVVRITKSVAGMVVREPADSHRGDEADVADVCRGGRYAR